MLYQRLMIAALAAPVCRYNKLVNSLADSKWYPEKYFGDTDGAYPTLPEEQEEFETEAEWTIITEADFKHFAENLAHIQNAIDGVQEKIENGDSRAEYTFNSDCFLI